MRFIKSFAVLMSAAAGAAGTVHAQPSVVTQDYDMSRSGANLAETILTPSSVSSTTFGKLFAYSVDEEVWAQPLYVPNLSIAGVSHNVVFVATQGNSVYAFDADNPATSNAPLWSVNLGTPVPASKFSFLATGVSHAGIYSTPVIDPGLNAMYVVTLVWNTASQSVSMQLHALNIANGQEMFSGPVTISATDFDPGVNEQLGGLLLLNGIVYIPIASHGDFQTNLANLAYEPYFGMVLAYNETTLAQVGSFNTEPGGMGAGIWQGGRGLASDGSYIYAQVANEYSVGTSDYSETFVQLNPGTLTVNDYYRDPDAACLNKIDLDLASSGPQIIPGAGTNLLVGGGKEGKVYTLQLDQALRTQTAAYFWGTSDYPTLPAEGGTCSDPRVHPHGWIQGSDTAFWNNPSGASYYYAFGNYDELISWQVSGNAFSQTSADTPPSTHPNALAVSANGGTNGILWTIAPQQNASSIVSAYNAVPAGGHLTKLWTSTTTVTRDVPGNLGRYSVPTVANGKLYVGTGSNQVVAYGLLPTTPSVTVTAGKPTLNMVDLDKITDIIYVNPYGGYKGTVSLSVAGLPPGVTYSFNKTSVTLTAKSKATPVTLTISPADAVLPLKDNYTVTVEATATGAGSSSIPIRFFTRSATFPTATSAGCNSSNQMSANLTWQINGSSTPTIWIQDSASPNFPGRVWLDPAADKGSGQTPYSVDNRSSYSLYWVIDQSAGIPTIIDNAVANINLAALYKCP